MGHFQTPICEPKRRMEILGIASVSTAGFHPAGSGERGQPWGCPGDFWRGKKLRAKIPSLHNCGHWNWVLRQSEPGHPLPSPEIIHA